jgi:hypothetical protein
LEWGGSLPRRSGLREDGSLMRACERKTATPFLRRGGGDWACARKAVSPARAPPLPPHSKLGPEKDVRYSEGGALGSYMPRFQRYKRPDGLWLTRMPFGAISPVLTR